VKSGQETYRLRGLVRRGATIFTFTHLLKQIVHTGSLELVDGRGRVHNYGDGQDPRARVRLQNRQVDYAIGLNPELKLGEAYTNGTLTIEEGSLLDFLTILARNFSNVRVHPFLVALSRLRSFVNRHNSITTARRNVAHHYDLSHRLYELFLDKDLQYSCAYFETGLESLDEAQLKKKAHLAAKLLLNEPNLSVLDIGCGWGGLGLYLAREHQARVLGITLSTEQQAVAAERAVKDGLSARAEFVLRDYREVKGTFDRIVSVGMFEHVGKRHYPEFFCRVRDLLKDDGIAVLHTIGWSDDPSAINPFIKKYIFPGAELPSLSEIMSVIERTGLVVTDIEVLRQHYADTLKHWRLNFTRNRDAIRELYDERFCRMWEFYLTACETFFRYRTQVVFQIQVSKSSSAVPLTRDYIYRAAN
jgi:cyclopropane-fatty-acyl-phospholipid synthase